MRYFPVSVDRCTKAYDIPSGVICKFCHLGSRKVSLKLQMVHGMAATTFGEVQVQHEILDFFCWTTQTRKGK